MICCDKKEGKTEEEREERSHLVHRNHKAQTVCRDSSVQASDVGGVGRGTQRTDTSRIKYYRGYQCGLWCGAQWLSSLVSGLCTPSATHWNLWQLLIHWSPPPRTLHWCPHIKGEWFGGRPWYTCLLAFTFFFRWKSPIHDIFSWSGKVKKSYKDFL